MPVTADLTVANQRFCLQAGAVVLDPMCGLGTILLEAAKEWPVSSKVW